ncbi:hypothetical protein [Microbacterium sp.]|uniref:hypothetical protein n=1 Tax=Microbacterium sp. TaxID=51671 RepID=UPI003C78805C
MPPEIPSVPAAPATVEPLPSPGILWSTDRPELVALQWEARRRIASPWGMLAIALLESLLTIPHGVLYRSAQHPEGSPLNLAVALVGSSGAGKSTLFHGVAYALEFQGADAPEPESVRSGEGIPALLGWMEKGDDGAAALVWRRHDHAVSLHYDEVGQLGAQAARTGSTISDAIKSLTSGERLGGQNSKGDGLTIPARSYRAVVTVAVQPSRAAPLLSEESIAGGLGARFVYALVEDPTIAHLPIPAQPTERVAVPLTQWDNGVRFVDALPAMDAAHEADTRAAHRGEREPVDSRLLLNRAILAIAFANLAGRAVLILEDWELAGAFIAQSLQTREAVQDALAAPVEDQRAQLEARAVARMHALQAEGLSAQEARRRLSRAQGNALTAMIHEGRFTMG